MRRPNRRPNYTKTEDIENWEEIAAYVIYEQDADFIALNGRTGAEEREARRNRAGVKDETTISTSDILIYG